MGIKAIDYDDLKEGDLITWYGMHVLRWEDDIRPLGIEPTIAFVQDDTLESENQRLVDVADRRSALLKMHENDRISFGNRCPFCYSPGSKHIESCRLAKELSDERL